MRKTIKWTVLLLLTLVAGLVLFITYIFLDIAYGTPYQSHNLSAAQIPTFSEIAVPHTHIYDEKESLPIMGSAIIDVDNDGTEELFLAGGFNQPDTLSGFRDTSFVDVSGQHGLKKSTDAATYGAAVVDADQDGFADMFVARNDGVYFYKNNQGIFQDEKLAVQFTHADTPLSLAVTDLNHDGHPDLYVSAYLLPEEIGGLTIFNDESYGGQSIMLLNNGDNSFTDITRAAGLQYVHNTFQATFVDIDQDGEQDLVVAHDTGVVKTWRNNGDLTFTDMPNPTSSYFAYPMGIAVGDYNNDGWVDFGFSNVGDMGPLTFLLRGDLLDDQVLNPSLIILKNNGDFTFTDVAEELKIKDYEFSWGLLFEDFTGDNRDDMVIAQNYISFLPHKIFKAPSRFLVQTDAGFETVEKAAGTINRAYPTSPLFADFNNDGALDFVYANLNGTARAFISNKSDTDYLGVTLPDIAASQGARVTVDISGEKITKTFTTSEGLASDSSHRLLFGIPAGSSIASLQIQYLDGRKETLLTPAVNQYIKIE